MFLFTDILLLQVRLSSTQLNALMIHDYESNRHMMPKNSEYENFRLCSNNFQKNNNC